MIKLYRREKPTFYGQPAKETTTLVKNIEMESGQKIEIPKDAKWMELIDAKERDTGYRHNRDEHYAEINFHSDERINPNFNEERIKYENDYKKHLKEVKKWIEEMEEIDRKEEAQEKALLKELKDKYEPTLDKSSTKIVLNDLFIDAGQLFPCIVW